MRFLPDDAFEQPRHAEKIEALLERAAAREHGTLFEHEAYELFALAGIAVPAWHFHEAHAEIDGLERALPHAGPFVAKVVLEGVTHKTEHGGLLFNVTKERAADAVGKLRERFSSNADFRGVLFAEQIAHDATLAGEMLLGLYQDPFFGPCVALGFGGTRAEHYQAILPPNRSTVMIPAAVELDSIDHVLHTMPVVELVEGRVRGASQQLAFAELEKPLRILQTLGRYYSAENAKAPFVIEELESNPAVAHEGRVLALDGVVRGRRNDDPRCTHKPLEKVGALLHPASVAIAGASGKNPANPSNIILRKFRSSGIDPKELFVVHPKEEEVEGVPCVPDLAALLERRGGEPVDCLVVGVPAKIAGGLIAECFDRYAARSLMIISSGFGETERGRGMQEELTQKLHALDATPERRPVVNGPNTLGNVFHDVNTLFTPNYKSSGTGEGKRNAALICQSGAFMITRISDMAGVIAPEVAVSVGNQMDLTVVDFLEALLDDERIDVYGLYIEGLGPGDGARLMRLTGEAARRGKFVVVYKTGRTEAGMEAAKGHTAAMAGDYHMFAHLAWRAGAMVAESSEDFQQLMLLATHCEGLAALRDLPAGKLGVAALSNAGFEKCALADHLMANDPKTFELARYTEETREHLREILTEHGVAGIVDQGDVLDLSPMTNDAGFEAIVRTVLADSNTHVGVFAVVPETVMLTTCEKGEGHREDMHAEGALLGRLIAVHRDVQKPFVVSMESGWKYDGFRRALIDAGIPCYAHVDDAARAVATAIDAIRRDA